MTANTLLQRLDRIKETGHGKFIACCPAHDDRSPSLSISERDDGKVLIHCFAGCETEDVLSAIGLTFSDLMPERIGGEHKNRAHRFDARQVLATLDHESLVIAIIGADFLEHRVIDELTWNRLANSVGRVNAARALAAPLRYKK